jgi:hypothetical protein
MVFPIKVRKIAKMIAVLRIWYVLIDLTFWVIDDYRCSETIIPFMPPWA